MLLCEIVSGVPSVASLSAVAPYIVAPSGITLSGITLSGITLSGITLSGITPSAMVHYSLLATGANGLPYVLPIHPNLVHLTLGLFIVAIAFDIVATFYVLEKPLFKFLAIPVNRTGLYDVGWFNMVAAAIITFFTVAAGFYEMLLANPPQDMISPWGLSVRDTMVWHGVGGVLLLGLIVGMTLWRALQRYLWREDRGQQVGWNYLLAGLFIFVLMFAHGTLGAHLGGDFGVHVTADRLIRAGIDPNQLVEPPLNQLPETPRQLPDFSEATP